ncbi:MAG: hypothetical protein ACXWLM_04160, partial [Myxococcales bacterium]
MDVTFKAYDAEGNETAAAAGVEGAAVVAQVGETVRFVWSAEGASGARLARFDEGGVEGDPVADGLPAQGEHEWKLEQPLSASIALVVDGVEVSRIHVSAGKGAISRAAGVVGGDAGPWDAWPLVLVGPMVRRVEPKLVCVFVATKAPCAARLKVAGVDPPNPPAVDLTPLGPHLYVGLLRFEPAEELKPGQAYVYDVEIRENGKDAFAGFEKLAEDDPSLANLGYGSALPSFVTAPADVSELRILHGSCRKPGGSGADALSIADDLIADGISNGGRPHQLVLTGDQIYADEVPASLSWLCHAVGLALLVPHRTNEGGKLTFDAAAMEKMPAGGRRQVPLSEILPGTRARRNHVKAALGSRCSGHLLAFHEFAAMYCLAWSPALWPASDKLEVGWYPPPAPAQWTEADAAARRFAQTLPRVRRALANIATYTMLDDREVTQNWNRSRRWVERARANGGKRIVRNALFAYCLFQDSGNRPHWYESGRGQQIGAALVWNGDAPAVLSADAALDDWALPAGDPEDNLGFSYLMEFPAHRLLALDLRTTRGFPDGKSADAALLSDAAMDEQLPPPAGNRTCKREPGPVTFVVSPVPCIDHAIVDRLAIAGKSAAPVKFEAETWEAQGKTLRRFLSLVEQLPNPVILGGEAPFAYSTGLTDRTTGKRIAQFCSSSLRNEGGVGLAIAAAANSAPKLPRGVRSFGELPDEVRSDALVRLEAPGSGDGEHQRRMLTFDNRLPITEASPDPLGAYGDYDASLAISDDAGGDAPLLIGSANIAQVAVEPAATGDAATIRNACFWLATPDGDGATGPRPMTSLGHTLHAVDLTPQQPAAGAAPLLLHPKPDKAEYRKGEQVTLKWALAGGATEELSFEGPEGEEEHLDPSETQVAFPVSEECEVKLTAKGPGGEDSRTIAIKLKEDEGLSVDIASYEWAAVEVSKGLEFATGELEVKASLAVTGALSFKEKVEEEEKNEGVEAARKHVGGYKDGLDALLEKLRHVHAEGGWIMEFEALGFGGGEISFLEWTFYKVTLNTPALKQDGFKGLAIELKAKLASGGKSGGEEKAEGGEHEGKKEVEVKVFEVSVSSAPASFEKEIALDEEKHWQLKVGVELSVSGSLTAISSEALIKYVCKRAAQEAAKGWELEVSEFAAPLAGGVVGTVAILALLGHVIYGTLDAFAEMNRRVKDACEAFDDGFRAGYG